LLEQSQYSPSLKCETTQIFIKWPPLPRRNALEKNSYLPLIHAHAGQKAGLRGKKDCVFIAADCITVIHLETDSPLMTNPTTTTTVPTMMTQK
jgi:hypothetical protein